jgi:hypothetical protein
MRLLLEKNGPNENVEFSMKTNWMKSGLNISLENLLLHKRPGV